jgi:hypothetical protein
MGVRRSGRAGQGLTKNHQPRNVDPLALDPQLRTSTDCSDSHEPQPRPALCPIFGCQPASVDRQLIQECGAGSDDPTGEVVSPMGGDHLHLVANNPCSDRSGRFGPTADRILGIAIWRVAVSFVHTCRSRGRSVPDKALEHRRHLAVQEAQQKCGRLRQRCAQNPIDNVKNM